ncbi:MAG: DUF6328 family protein [Gaiellales bacterium]
MRIPIARPLGPTPRADADKAPGGEGGDRDDESADERHNRQLIELLNELRVALPGVQMLFGFLLAVPFSQGFGSIGHGQRVVYYLTFLAAALASACLIAPASLHRMVWRHHRKRQVIHVSNVLALVGLGFLACAIAGSVGLVTSVLYGTSAAAIGAGCIAGLVVLLWFALPLADRLAQRVDPGDEQRIVGG